MWCAFPFSSFASLGRSQLAPGSPESQDISHEREAIPTAKEASTVQEYLSYISSPSVKEEPLMSNAPPPTDQIPSATSESQALQKEWANFPIFYN